MQFVHVLAALDIEDSIQFRHQKQTNVKGKFVYHSWPAVVHLHSERFCHCHIHFINVDMKGMHLIVQFNLTLYS